MTYLGAASFLLGYLFFRLPDLYFANYVVTFRRTLCSCSHYFSLIGIVSCWLHRLVSSWESWSGSYCLKPSLTWHIGFAAPVNPTFLWGTQAFLALHYVASYRVEILSSYFWLYGWTIGCIASSEIKSHSEPEISSPQAADRTAWSAHDCFCWLFASVFTGVPAIGVGSS